MLAIGPLFISYPCCLVQQGLFLRVYSQRSRPIWRKHGSFFFSEEIGNIADPAHSLSAADHQHSGLIDDQAQLSA